MLEQRLLWILLPDHDDLVAGRVVQDTLSFHSTNIEGRKILAPVSVRRFTFVCASKKNLQDLSTPADGVLGISPADTSFPKQVTSALGVLPKFYLCLPSSTSGSGHLFVGGGLSFTRTLTPLTSNASSGSYSVTVQSIYVDGVPLPLKPDLLNGGAKLSSVLPYTILHTDIYSALAKSFTQRAKAMGISKVREIAPFKDCFNTRTVGRNLTGPNVPVIEIGVPGRAGEVKWRFYGANTVVKETKTVMCLAFLDGGKRLEIHIGTHQIQDYMLEFDLSTSLLGFSDSLLLQSTSCSTWISKK
ncbi:unnamed protein product [Microthlaspi erraticum]|uniref:Peptidase A1 domain-containing protein n=1 Tax=Microthlaspi erraticum TaxID=1685480 RepID=A0A6D2L493_9BRAS|nr:unnamed protein product [Microthlaspi erraticum]